MICLRLLLGAFFLFILLRAVCVLFGGIATWYSWVKFLGGFSPLWCVLPLLVPCPSSLVVVLFYTVDFLFDLVWVLDVVLSLSFLHRVFDYFYRVSTHTHRKKNYNSSILMQPTYTYSVYLYNLQDSIK